MVYSDPKRNAVFKAIYVGSDPLTVCDWYDADQALAIILLEGTNDVLPFSSLRRESLLADLEGEATGHRYAMLIDRLGKFRPTLDVAAWAGGMATAVVPILKAPTELPDEHQTIVLATARRLEVSIVGNFVRNAWRHTGEMDDLMTVLTDFAQTMQRHLRIEPITRLPLMKLLHAYDVKRWAGMMLAMYNAVCTSRPYDEVPVISFVDAVSFRLGRSRRPTP